MPDDPKKPDILLRLRYFADHADDISPDEMEALLREAAEDIKTLRLLVGIRDDILLEDIEPEGHG